MRILLAVSMAMAVSAMAKAQEIQIQQVGLHNTTVVKAAGMRGRYVGFDVLADGKLVAPVRFTSGGLITCAKVEAKRQGNTSTLVFDHLTAKPSSGLELEGSRISVTLVAQKFPVIAFDLTLKAFDPAKWQATLGKQPFHFLTIGMPEATVWQHRGWLNATPKADPFPLLLDVHAGTPELSAYPYNRQWSTTPPLSAHPLPVIGLWSPEKRLYAAWDFQIARLTDNSERDIATGFCNRLLLPAPPEAMQKTTADTANTAKTRISPSSDERQTNRPLAVPAVPAVVDGLQSYAERKAEENANREGKTRFVALVYPYGGKGYQQLVYPKGGEHLVSRATFVYSTTLGSTDDPNRLLWQTWWDDDTLHARLPRVPAMNDLSWIPTGAQMKTLPGAPGGSLLGGVEGSFQVPGSKLIYGWSWHNESALEAPYKRGDTARVRELESEAATLVQFAKKFKVNGETCVYWEKPLTGRWTDAWGGAPVTTLHNANGWAAGRLLLDFYRVAGKKQYLPLIDGVFNWTKHIVWTRNEFADVPSSPFAIGGTLATAFLLDYYATFKNDRAHRTRALLALDMARSFTYRYMTLWTADSLRDDNLDSAFLWEPNSGRDWTGAACSNEVVWNLDTLAQTAVHTGDPILMWALQGTLSRWPLLYQEVYRDTFADLQPADFTEGYGLAPGNIYGYPGKRAVYGFGGPLTLLEPVGESVVRVVAGEKAALAFTKNAAPVVLRDYRCTGMGDFAVSFRSAGNAFAATITFPYADLSGKAVYLLRDGVMRLNLKPGEQVFREPNSVWSLLVRGLHDRDTLVVGNPDLTTAEHLPTLPPLTLPAAPLTDAQTAPFQAVTLPYDTNLEMRWGSPDGFAGLTDGLRWTFGVPFVLRAGKATRGTAPRVTLPQPVANAHTVYILYQAQSRFNEEDAMPLPVWDDGTLAEPGKQRGALGWRAWPAFSTQRLLVAAFDVPPGRTLTQIQMAGQAIFAVTVLPNSPNADTTAAQVSEALARGEVEWQALQSSDRLAKELQQVALRLPEGRVAILPPDTGASPANALIGRGGFRKRMTALTPEQLVDPAQFNAAKFPVALTLDGEDYLHTVKTPGDAAEALTRYLKEGGTLLLLSGLPYPMYYATGPNGMHKADPLLPRLGLPLYNAIETDPQDKLTAVAVSGQKGLIDIPLSFPLTPDDPRLRTVYTKNLPPGATYTPIYRVRGKLDKDYGDAAALLELPPAPDGKRGRIFYVSNVLLRDPDNGPRLVRAVLRWLVNAVNPTP